MLTGPKLKIIKPADVLGTVTMGYVTLSDPGTDPAAWSSAITYPLDGTASYNNSKWLSLQAANTNKVPGAAGSETWWVRTGPTNDAAMFDGAVNTKTISAGPLPLVSSVSIPRPVDTVVLADCTCLSATVQVDYLGQTAYLQTKTINHGTGGSWWAYLYSDRSNAYTGNLVFEGIPPYAGSVITVTLQPIGNVASVGLQILGRSTEIGVIEVGAVAPIRDFSKKTTDDYGTTTLTVGEYVSRPSYPVLIEARVISRVRQYLIDNRATPLYFYGSGGDPSLSLLDTYGWLQDHRIPLEFVHVSRATIEAEGLV